MSEKLIDSTFKYFTTPFVKANIARNEFIDWDSPKAAKSARMNYLAQIITSIVAIPLLILAGLFDILSCKANMFDLPKAIFTQLFIILPLSIIGAILPLSVSDKLDARLDKRTLTNRKNDLKVDCLPLLEARKKTLDEAQPGQPTIESDDLRRAILDKKTDLRQQTTKKDFATIQQDLRQAGIGTPLHADLYEMLKLKEQTINEKARDQSIQQLIDAINASPSDSVQHKDLSESLARKIAGDERLIPELKVDLERGRALNAAPDDNARVALLAGYPDDPARVLARLASNLICQAAMLTAIGKKCVNTFSLQELKDLAAPMAAGPEKTEVEQAIAQKQENLARLAASLSLEGLGALGGSDAVEALGIKSAELDQLATQPLSNLQKLVASSRNPVRTNDASEAIRRYYYKAHSFEQLWILARQTPDNQLLQDTVRRKTEMLDRIVLETTLEQLIEAPQGIESVNDHKDRMEMIQRKYIYTNTVAELQALFTAHPNDLNIKYASERKETLIRDLLRDNSIEDLNVKQLEEAHPVKQAWLTEAFGIKFEQVNDLIETKTRAELCGLRDACTTTVRRQDYEFIVSTKEERIKDKAKACTLAQLQNKEGIDPSAAIELNDCEEAARFKDETINSLVRNRTLERLRELRAVADISIIRQDDLDIAIQRKEEALAAAAVAAQPAVQAVAV